MTNGKRCGRCDRELPANAPEKLCPRCLLVAGLELGAVDSSEEPSPTDEPSGEGGRVRMDPPTGVLDSLLGRLRRKPQVTLRDDRAPESPVVKPSSDAMGRISRPGQRYLLLGEIARGGVGVILKGRDVDLGRDLAVKVLLEKHRNNPELLQRFIEEAQLGGQLEHPGIVPVHEVGVLSDNQPYFTMKLVRGRTLASLLEARKDPAEDQARLLGIFQQVCETVGYAHSRGVIHRDLKPSNIMVGGFGEVQVMDWGLAKVLATGGVEDDRRSDACLGEVETLRSSSDAELSMAGSVMGTPSYMAPEQASGQQRLVDERTDVFALGSILSEILTGAPAFTGSSSTEILRATRQADLGGVIVRLDACRADPALVGLTKACLAKDPKERPRDAKCIADDLSSHFADVQERLKAAELETVETRARAEEEVKRRRLRTVVSGLIMVLLVIGAGVLVFNERQRQGRIERFERALAAAQALRDRAAESPADVGRWHEALVAARQAREVVGDDTSDGSTSEIRTLLVDVEEGSRAAERDASLLRDLLDVRSLNREIADSAVDDRYAAAFRRRGWNLDGGAVQAAIDDLKARPASVVREIAGFLDHWVSIRRSLDETGAKWAPLVRVARVLDPDPYRDRIRALLLSTESGRRRDELLRLARDPRVAELPAPSAVFLARELSEEDEPDTAIDVLEAAAIAHPGDVWVHHELARLLSKLDPPENEEALRHHEAARALRPETAHDQAHLLQKLGRRAEAISIFRDLVRRQPTLPNHVTCLARALRQAGQQDEAMEFFRRAETVTRVALLDDPQNAQHHAALGMILKGLKRLDEALVEYRTALKLRPDYAAVRYNIGIVLDQLGRVDEALAAFRKAADDYPSSRESALYAYGQACSNAHRYDEAAAAYRELLREKPMLAYVEFALGYALKNAGRFEEAIAAFRRADELKSSAGEPTQQATKWIDKCRRWIDLDAKREKIARGEAEVTNPSEWIELAQVARMKGLVVESAQLWSRAFAAEPQAAETAPHRFEASRTAALAAAGRGRGTEALADEDRARWRGQALDWLRADLVQARRRLDTGDSGTGSSVRSTLGRWLKEPDLASVRDEAELAKLGPEERAAWHKLWSEVRALEERSASKKPG